MSRAPSPESDAQEPQRNAVGILLCSSDNTFDIGVQIAAAFDRHWPDCPYRRFVLTTTTEKPWPHPGWNRISAGAPTGWRKELMMGLLKLPAELENVLLVLDDFLLLARVDSGRTQALIAEAQRLGLAYLRLRPVDRSLAAAFVRRRFARSPIVALSRTEPYYSSLQLALWRRQHLLELLAVPNSIWDFERTGSRGEVHYAIAGKAPIRYSHVVERGRWLPSAASAFRMAGIRYDPGDRPTWGKRYALKHWVRRTRFALLGYSLMHLKARLFALSIKVVGRSHVL